MSESLRAIKKEAQARHIPLLFVPSVKLNALTSLVHQGVIATRSYAQYYDLQGIIDHSVSEGEVPYFLVLDGIKDVRNIGAIIRTAYVAGVKAIVMATKGMAPLGADTLKSSAGALLHSKICRVKHLSEALNTFQLNGIHCIITTTDAKDSTPSYHYDFSLPCALIIGGEEKGVNTEKLPLMQGKVHIPMLRSFDSYNVSVAAAMLCYEILRQKQLSFRK